MRPHYPAPKTSVFSREAVDEEKEKRGGGFKKKGEVLKRYFLFVLRRSQEVAEKLERRKS